MSIALARHPADDEVLDAYAAFSGTLGLSASAVELRHRFATRFIAAHPDLDTWMAGPLPGRLVDLARIKAWPLISWMILTDASKLTSTCSSVATWAACTAAQKRYSPTSSPTSPRPPAGSAGPPSGSPSWSPSP